MANAPTCPPHTDRSMAAASRARPYDGEAWQALIAELAALPSSPELLLERRALYDEFLTHFPTAVSFTSWHTRAPVDQCEPSRQHLLEHVVAQSII